MDHGIQNDGGAEEGAGALCFLVLACLLALAVAVAFLCVFRGPCNTRFGSAPKTQPVARAVPQPSSLAPSPMSAFPQKASAGEP